MRRNFDYVLYSLTLPHSIYSKDACDAEIKKFDSVSDYPVKMKVNDMTKRGITKVVMKNAKEMAYCCFNKDNGDGTWTLFAALSDNLAIYEFAEAILHTAKRNLYRYPTIIEEFLLRKQVAALDMFANSCSVCGEQIETDIWGEPVHSCLCMRHKYLEDFVHRDVDVSANSDDYLVESGSDDDSRFNRVELSMDDDLEDYVLKKSGNTSI